MTVAARRAAAAEVAAALAGGTAVDWDDRVDAARAADLVVNATPIGMAGDDALPLPARCASVPGRWPPTSCTSRGSRRGSKPPGPATRPVVPGLGMLVHQAALQVERWTGRPAPVDAMRAAVEV